MAFERDVPKAARPSTLRYQRKLMKPHLFYFLIIFLILACKSNHKKLDVEVKKEKSISSENKIKEVVVTDKLKNSNNPFAFPQTKSSIFEEFGYPDKVTDNKWVYYKKNGFDYIEANFKNCCDLIDTLEWNKDNSTNTIINSHCHIGSKDATKVERFKLDK